jgi:hypothetical protein
MADEAIGLLVPSMGFFLVSGKCTSSLSVWFSHKRGKQRIDPGGMLEVLERLRHVEGLSLEHAHTHSCVAGSPA